MGVLPKKSVYLPKNNMAKKVTVVDKTWRKKPFGSDEMMKDTNNPYPVDTEKHTLISRVGKLKKKVVGVNRESDPSWSEPDWEQSAKITKYDKSGKVKKTVTLVKDESNKINKTVSRNGKEAVSVKPGLLANRRIKKYI
jgi:hypothetical protein